MAIPLMCTVAGLVANLVGVVLLFRYGMAYKVRRGGTSALLLTGINQTELNAERRYSVLGWLGLVLVIVGTAAQVVGAMWAPAPGAAS